MGLLLSEFANSRSYGAALLQRAAGWVPPPTSVPTSCSALFCRQAEMQEPWFPSFSPQLETLIRVTKGRQSTPVCTRRVQQRQRLKEMSGIFTIVGKCLCVTWAESVGGAQSPALSFAVSKPPHLRDLMSDTRRHVSIDLSDTWGSCQTHLHSEASTHTSTSTHIQTRTGNKAGQTTAFPRQLDLTHWLNLSTVLFLGLPGECLSARRLQVSRDIWMVPNWWSEI